MSGSATKRFVYDKPVLGNWRFVGQDNMEQYNNYNLPISSGVDVDAGLLVSFTPQYRSDIRGILHGMFQIEGVTAGQYLNCYAHIKLANATLPEPESAKNFYVTFSPVTSGSTIYLPISVNYVWENVAPDTLYSLTAIGYIGATGLTLGALSRWNLQMDVRRIGQA